MRAPGPPLGAAVENEQAARCHGGDSQPVPARSRGAAVVLFAGSFDPVHLPSGRDRQGGGTLVEPGSRRGG